MDAEYLVSLFFFFLKILFSFINLYFQKFLKCTCNIFKIKWSLIGFNKWLSKIIDTIFSVRGKTDKVKISRQMWFVTLPAEEDSEQCGAGHIRLPQVRALAVMWTIFKVFTEFVILLLFYVLFFWPQGIIEPTPSELVGDGLTTGLPGKSLNIWFSSIDSEQAGAILLSYNRYTLMESSYCL